MLNDGARNSKGRRAARRRRVGCNDRVVLSEKQLVAILGVVAAVFVWLAAAGYPLPAIVPATIALLGAFWMLFFHWPRAVVLSYMVALLLPAVAFVLGYSPWRAVSHPLPRSVSQDDITIGYPDGWERVESGPEFPGIKLASAIALERKRPDGSGILAGLSSATGRAMLSREFLARLSRAPTRHDRVVLGGVGPAHRYRSMRPRGVNRSLTIIVAPTTKGILTVVCYADPVDARKFARECEGMWKTVSLRHAKPSPLGADPAYAKALSSVIEELNRTRPRVQHRVRAAPPEARSNIAASAFRHAFAIARRRLGRAHVSPVDRDVHMRILAALATARDAYAHAAEASATNHQSLWRRARTGARAAEASLRLQVSGLAERGYALR